jgi:hypothetical protein
VRISAKRKRALTVVIDFEHGLLCPTSHIASRRDDVAATVADLARRERAPIESIGFFDRVAGSARSRHEPILEWMDRWLAESGIEAAVWTDLTRNFEELTAVDYSIGAAVDYLRSLDGESRIEARRYIENAPAAVATPLRRVLAGQSWWQEIEYDAGIGMQEQRGR